LVPDRKKRSDFSVIFTVFSLVFQGFAIQPAPAAQAVNVQYIHDYIQQKHGVTVPIKASNPLQIANVKYLLCAVDRGNEIMNGVATNYCNHALATQQVVDTVATIDAVNRLMKRAVFSVTLTGTDAFSFQISASGTFSVDWGDGTTVETITKSDTTDTLYSHTYASIGNYTVQFAGTATGYSSDETTPAISFYNSTNRAKMTQIAGSLGAIFPTIGTISPRFVRTFSGCTGLTSIPSGLFSGINGAPVGRMFYSTFSGCTGLTGAIPAGLFGTLNGAPAQYMFYSTFYGCTGLTGTIPAGLFGTLNGAPAANMFDRTFARCSSLTGAIPAGLFSGISGAPAQQMFYQTFYGCTGLTGIIPAGLFGTLNGAPAQYMFYSTFYGCTGLTGIADGIWNISGVTNADATSVFGNMFMDCNKITSASPNIAPGSSVRLYTKFTAITSPGAPFSGCTSMSDYASMPDGWK
jgi:hypothetical protein